MFSQDDQLLASASSDKTIRLWDPEMGKEIWKFEGHTQSIRAIAFSQDSRLLASASSDKTIRLWNLTNKKELQKLMLGTEMLRFSDRGPFLETDVGILPVRLLTPTNTSTQSDVGTILICEGWLARDHEKVVWLPPQYRPVCSAFQDNTLALACASGRLIFMRFT
jgi:WD40 repeat protein